MMSSATRGLELELHGARIVPADLEQVAQQRLEALDLSVQQLGRAVGRRVEGVPLVVEHVGGQPDRGQRRAQFVRDVGDEALLHQRQFAEFLDLRLDAVGHGVEGGRERRELVLSVDGEAHLEVTRGEPGAGARRFDDRARDRAHHDPGDPGDERDEDEAGRPQGALHELERSLGVGEVVGDVHLERADLGHEHLLAHDDARRGGPVGQRQRDRLPGLALRERDDALAQPGAEQVDVEVRREGAHAAAHGKLIDREDGDVRGGRRAWNRVLHIGPQPACGRGVIGDRGRIEVALGRGDGTQGVAEDLVPA